MKRILPILMLCTLLMNACSCSVSNFKDIKVKSFDVVSITPAGLSAVDAVVDVEVDNPAIDFAISRATGVLRYNGDECLTVTATDMVQVEGKSDKVYRVPLHGVLADNFNPFSFLTLLKSRDMTPFTVDVSAYAALRGGIGKELEFKGLPLSKLLQNPSSVIEENE